MGQKDPVKLYRLSFSTGRRTFIKMGSIHLVLLEIYQAGFYLFMLNYIHVEL